MTARAKETHSDLAAAPPRSASEQGESGRALTVPGSGKGLGGDLAVPHGLGQSGGDASKQELAAFFARLDQQGLRR